MTASRMELLAPAGGPGPFNAAVAAGADAIFCGFGHHFNARRGAESFDDASFEAACRRAHLAGTRVYVTSNVVIRTDELLRALSMIRRAWLLGADAFIIQDWGLLSLVRRLWPEIEVHVSTQANVHDARGVAWCRDRFGVDRVTLSRELSLPEIARIAQEGVELEGFAHGALCFCYSGICMLSMLGGGRSANRGMCAQPCRLPYELVDERGAALSEPNVRPLCPKDCNTVERLGELRAAGLSSLKIEGRLKGPDYVYAVVRAYRAALDELEGREAAFDGPTRARLLRRAFNRDFTSAYLDGRSDNDMMSYERSNNRGELVGSVVATRDLGSSRVWRGGANGGRERSRKVTRAEVDVLLSEPVGKGDLLEIRPQEDPTQFLTTHALADARAGETITCTTTRPMRPGCPVRVIRSQAALDAAERVARSDAPRLREVLVSVEARLGMPFAVTLACADDPGLSVRVEGPIVEAARTRALTAEDLIEHVGRFGGSGFVATSIDVALDEGCGMAFSQVHKVRSQACKRLGEAILAPWRTRELEPVPSAARLTRDLRESLAGGGEVAGGIGSEPEVADRLSARRPQGLRESWEGSEAAGVIAAEPEVAHRAIDSRESLADGEVSNELAVGPEAARRAVGCAGGMLAEPEVCCLVSAEQTAAAARAAGATRLYARADVLYEGTQPNGRAPWAADVVPWLDEVCREVDHDHLDPLVAAGESACAGNVSELALAAERGAFAEVGPSIPVHNEAALAALANAGATGVWLSPELSLEEMVALAEVSPVPLGLSVFGRTRAMTSEHCVLQVANRCVHDCARCELRTRDLRLRNDKGEEYPVRTDIWGRSRLYAARPVDATPEIGALVDAGVKRLMVDATLLDERETAAAVHRVVEQLRRAETGEPPLPRLNGCDSGHLYNPVA